MRTLWLIVLFGVSALGAFALTRAIDDLVPDPPPPVEAIELDWSAPVPSDQPASSVPAASSTPAAGDDGG